MDNFGKLTGDVVQFQRVLPGPIERVWAFLVDSEKRARWLAAGTTAPLVGGAVELSFENAKLSALPDALPAEKYREMPACVTFTGVVTQYDAPHLLRYTWGFDGEESEVSFELVEQGDAVLLTLTHRRLKASESLLSVSAGWHTHLDILTEVIRGGEVQPFWKRHNALEVEYELRYASL